MLRKIVLTTMMALAVPTVGMAQREEHPERGRPVPGESRGPRPGEFREQRPGEFRGPRPGEFREQRPGEFRETRPGGPEEFRGPYPGGPPGRFVYHGSPFNPVHVAPFVYPRGWAYRRWVIGAVLPPLFLAPAYYYSGWADLGLPPPQPGFQWVRYGPDLLLVDLTTGEVVDTVYGAFY
jgi:Ni/Co efflux regulator RcnB